MTDSDDNTTPKWPEEDRGKEWDFWNPPCYAFDWGNTLFGERSPVWAEASARARLLDFLNAPLSPFGQVLLTALPEYEALWVSTLEGEDNG